MSPTPKSVEEMIAGLPRTEQVVAQRLRALVHECLPMATEKSYYGEGIPFYTHNRLICFVWPSSVDWSGKASTKPSRGVTLGFNQGNLMSNDEGVLLAEGRKQVYCMYFKSLAEIDDQQVRALLFEAWAIDEGFKKRKVAKRSRL